MPAPTIYYIRHGETAWNAAGRFQGSQDIPLNDLGRTQAMASGGILADLLARDGHAASALRFVASPLGRARLTMELMREKMNLPSNDYAVDDRLREIGFGQWEGMTLSEMQLHDTVTFAARHVDKWGTAAPSGESYASDCQCQPQLMAVPVAGDYKTEGSDHEVVTPRRTSSTMLPSRSVIHRSQWRAASSLWVTRTIVVPNSL